MYGRRATNTPKGGEPGAIPAGYSETEDNYNQPGPEGGRPKEKMSVYGTQQNPVGGRDPLGQHGMKGGYPSDNEYVMENTLANTVYLQNKDMLKSLVFEDKQDDNSKLLDEDNIKDLGN